jgi:hypothetical protein
MQLLLQIILFVQEVAIELNEHFKHIHGDVCVFIFVFFPTLSLMVLVKIFTKGPQELEYSKWKHTCKS